MTTPQKNNAISSRTDSLFGLALSEAFMGVVWGPGAYIAMEASEAAMEIYDDRRDDKQISRTDMAFELGAKDRKLTGAFAGASSSPATPAPLDWTPRISPELHVRAKSSGYQHAL